MSYNPGGPRDPVSQGHCAPAALVPFTTMATIFETLTSKPTHEPTEVDYPDLNGGGLLFEMRRGCTAAAPDEGIISVRALLPKDVPMAAVPSEFAAFVGNQVPRIEIRHHGLGHDGARSRRVGFHDLAHDGYSRHECFLEDVVAW